MDRQGFDEWWSNVDVEIQNEVLESLKSMMKDNL